MILRKPYAVFIRRFKLLHVILFIVSAFLLYTSFSLFRFFDAYSIDYRSVTGNYSPSNYLNGFSYIFAFFSLILTIIFLSVMIYKKKPKNLYVYNLILYLSLIVFYFFCNSALNDISIKLLDIKLSKALRDFSLIVCILQLISTILVFVRATGFDIKQFDFSTDLQKLDISEKDSEEIEVALSFDKDEVRRNYKRRIRNIKYVYFEHKFIINVSFVVFLVAISLFIYSKTGAYYKNVNQGNTFDVSNVTMNVTDSFILEKSADGDDLVVTDGDLAGAVVLVRFQIKGYGVKEYFNTGLVNLKIGDFSYSQNTSITQDLYDMGSAYEGEELNDEFRTYIMAFEIAKNNSYKDMVLKVNDNNSFMNGVIGAKSILVKLKPQDLRKDGQSFEKTIGDSINFDDSILGSSSLKINSFEISNAFKLPYKYCYSEGKCMDSYEYVTPTTTGNYFKLLMKIDGDISFDKNLNIVDIYDMRTFLNNFGTISYLVDGSMVSKKIDSGLVKPKVSKADSYFIEVPYDIKDSPQIYLSFKIRNQNYKYVLK